MGKSKPEIDKTVYIRLWTPDKRHIALVKNRPEFIRDVYRGRVYEKNWGWGLVGGGQRPKNDFVFVNDYEEWIILAREVIKNAQVSEEVLQEVATVARETWEESGLFVSEYTIDDVKSRQQIFKNPTHCLVVFDAFYYTDDISKGLASSDPKGQVTEARWIAVEDLQSGFVDNKKIYKSHLDIINDIEDPRYTYKYGLD